jgi:nicotinamide-nucleotide amidase
MWQETAVPYLQSQGWGKEPIYSRMLRFWGISEALLAEKVAAFLDLTNPTVAPYAGQGEVKLRIAAKAESAAAAEALIAPVEKQLREIARIDYYGADNDSLASVVGELLQAAGETLAVAESCTGGGLGQMLTAIPGSSSYFWGGIISYHNQAKISLLGVNPADLEEFGAVSDIIAEQMAVGVKNRLNTTWGLSITGIAGPGGGTEVKPVGLVYIGLAGPNLVTNFKIQLHPQQDRNAIRQISAGHALDQLRRQIFTRNLSDR